MTRIVKLAARAKLPVVPRGSGTGLSGGSVVAEERELNGSRWWVMADPEGNEFCLALDD